MAEVQRCAMPSPRGGAAGGSDHEAAPSYTASLRRYAACLEARDYSCALGALNDAIDTEPGLAQGYLLRAGLWRLLGDYVRASCDYATCLAIDPCFTRRADIGRSALAVAETCRTDPVLDESWLPGRWRSEALRDAVQAKVREASRRRAVLERPSCSLPCPSTCCYFEEESVSYGVHVSSAELPALRAFLQKASLPEATHIARLPKHECSARIRWPDGCFVRADDGTEYLYYPLRSERRLGAIPAAGRPRTLTGADIIWLTARSRGCAFLTEAGCGVHDVGDPPGLGVCRSFLCLTGVVFVVLRHAGVVADPELAALPIERLHDDAIAVVGALARTLAGPETAAAQAEMKRALAAAIEADAVADSAGLRSSLSRYEAARSQFDRHQRRRLQSIRERLQRQWRRGRTAGLKDACPRAAPPGKRRREQAHVKSGNGRSLAVEAGVREGGAGARAR